MAYSRVRLRHRTKLFTNRLFGRQLVIVNLSFFFLKFSDPHNIPCRTYCSKQPAGFYGYPPIIVAAYPSKFMMGKTMV